MWKSPSFSQEKKILLSSIKHHRNFFKQQTCSDKDSKHYKTHATNPNSSSIYSSKRNRNGSSVPSIAGQRRHAVAEDAEVAVLAAAADEELVNGVSASVHRPRRVRRSGLGFGDSRSSSASERSGKNWGFGDETFADCTLDITVMSNESSLSGF